MEQGEERGGGGGEVEVHPKKSRELQARCSLLRFFVARSRDLRAAKSITTKETAPVITSWIVLMLVYL